MFHKQSTNQTKRGISDTPLKLSHHLTKVANYIIQKEKSILKRKILPTLDGRGPAKEIKRTDII